MAAPQLLARCAALAPQTPPAPCSAAGSSAGSARARRGAPRRPSSAAHAHPHAPTPRRGGCAHSFAPPRRAPRGTRLPAALSAATTTAAAAAPPAESSASSAATASAAAALAADTTGSALLAPPPLHVTAGPARPYAEWLPPDTLTWCARAALRRTHATRTCAHTP
jgi:hypothetical protein